MSKEIDELVQSEHNCNVAFYIHLKEFNNNVREELEKRISDVFFFSKGVNWRFDSFGIENAGERRNEILGYFIFRATDVDKLKKLFVDEFKDYKNAAKISCSVAKYQKVCEEFFEIDL